MILTHFIACCAQPAVKIVPEPATGPLLISASAIITRPLGGDGWPLLRVGAAPATLTVGRVA
jgi:hypothetical protein